MIAATPAYVDMCKGKSFLLSKSVHKENGFECLAEISKAKYKLEVQTGAKIGGGTASKRLEADNFPDGVPLGAGSLLLQNEDLSLYSEALGDNWGEVFGQYADATKFGVLILAVKPENIKIWANSEICQKEAQCVPRDRLYAYIEHTNEDEGGKQGYIVKMNTTEQLAGSPTVNNGKGYAICANGAYYHGDIKDGKYNGQGKYHYVDGSIFVGEFKDGKSHGKGTYLFKDGDIYGGEFKDGMMHGQGTYTYSKSGAIYDGEWENGNYHGKGIQRYGNGDVYEGEWKDNKKNGKGRFERKSASWPLSWFYTQDGIWEDDQFVGMDFLPQCSVPSC